MEEEKTTENAAKSWDKENMRTLACRVRIREAEAFKLLARELGSSTHAMLAGYVRDCLKSATGSERDVWRDMRKIMEENRRLAHENQELKYALKAAVARGDNAEKVARMMLGRYTGENT